MICIQLVCGSPPLGVSYQIQHHTADDRKVDIPMYHAAVANSTSAFQNDAASDMHLLKVSLSLHVFTAISWCYCRQTRGVEVDATSIIALAFHPCLVRSQDKPIVSPAVYEAHPNPPQDPTAA